MRSETFKYSCDGKEFDVFVVYKSQRNINLRLKKDGIHISAPTFCSHKKAMEALNTLGPKLVKKYSQNFEHFSFAEDYLFLLGKRVKLSELGISSEDELNVFLKQKAGDILPFLVRKYEKIMGIDKPYKVGIRKSTTRYGSNSLTTHALSFQLDLIHYSEEIISTVVVHELAHEFHRNHQQDFYDCVYLYCPSYDVLQKKLKRGIHE